MIEGILETALYAEDLDKAEAFYDDVLCLEKIRRGGNRHIFYRCGSGVLLIFNPAETSVPIADDPFPVPTHGAKGPGHVCFFVARDDLDAMARRLQEAGVPIESELTWPNGARSIYFRDPAGNSLECASRTLWTS
jgi:catechol 2,3-dioxygenase-like lactoylglutathione lyase family enzyme